VSESVSEGASAAGAEVVEETSDPLRQISSSHDHASTTARDPDARCCDPSFELWRALKQGLANSLSATGLAIFSKDIAAAALIAWLTDAGYDPTVGALLIGVNALAGLRYGATQQAVSRFISAMVNYGLGVGRYAPAGETDCDQFVHEFGSQSLPSIACYSLAHAVRGYLTAGMTGNWELAGSKLAASTIAGFIQGFAVDALYLQRWPEHFTKVGPGQSFEDNFTLHMKKLGSDLNAKKIGREYVGRAIASAGAFAAADAIGFVDVIPGQRSSSPGEAAMSAGLSRFVFQSGYCLFGTHLGAWVGGRIDDLRGRDGRPARGGPAVVADPDPSKIPAEHETIDIPDEAGSRDSGVETS
jgi:hypothetical protein